MRTPPRGPRPPRPLLAARTVAISCCAAAGAAVALAGCGTAYQPPANPPISLARTSTTAPPATAPTQPTGTRQAVPATARVATVVETRNVPGTTSDGKLKTVVVAKTTVTSASQVAGLARYLDKLPVNPPGGQWSCPAQSLADGHLTLTFSARAGGPALAEASAGLTGCAFLTYDTGGKPQLALGGGDAGESLLTEFNHVTGLHWKVPQG